MLFVVLCQYTSVSWLHTITGWGNITPCPITLASPGLGSIQLKPFITGIGGSGDWGETCPHYLAISRICQHGAHDACRIIRNSSSKTPNCYTATCTDVILWYYVSTPLYLGYIRSQVGGTSLHVPSLWQVLVWAPFSSNPSSQV